MAFSCRRIARLALPIMLVLGASMPRVAAAAEDWVEPRFDPPVGSKWTIERELNAEKVNAGTMVGHTLKETALLTIEAKTADGFLVTYTRQSSTYDGDTAGAAAQRLAFAAQQGLVIRIATDAAGKPLRIVNFDEVKAALKKASEVQPAGSENPVVLDSVRRCAEVDDKRAAALCLDALPLLAVAQNTGLKPGEIRKSTLPVANAPGPGIAKTLTLSIAKTYPDTGAVRYLMTETYDADSMKALVAEAVKQRAVTNVSAVEQAIKSAVVASVARAQFDVAGGMTRELRRRSVTSFRFPDSHSVTTEDELVTVSPAEVAAAATPTN